MSPAQLLVSHMKADQLLFENENVYSYPTSLVTSTRQLQHTPGSGGLFIITRDLNAKITLYRMSTGPLDTTEGRILRNYYLVM